MGSVSALQQPGLTPCAPRGSPGASLLQQRRKRRSPLLLNKANQEVETVRLSLLWPCHSEEDLGRGGGVGKCAFSAPETPILICDAQYVPGSMPGTGEAKVSGPALEGLTCTRGSACQGQDDKPSWALSSTVCKAPSTPMIPHSPVGLMFCRGAHRVPLQLKRRTRYLLDLSQILVLPCISCVALDKPLHLSEPQIPRL